MELEKSNIHMNKIVESQRATFYVTKECNLPEQSMESIINHQEKIILDSGIIRGNQVIINGNVSYGIMFYGEDNAPSGVTGEIPFEENIKINTTEENINKVTLRLVNLNKIFFNSISSNIKDINTKILAINGL